MLECPGPSDPAPLLNHPPDERLVSSNATCTNEGHLPRAGDSRSAASKLYTRHSLRYAHPRTGVRGAWQAEPASLSSGQVHTASARTAAAKGMHGQCSVLHEKFKGALQTAAQVECAAKQQVPNRLPGSRHLGCCYQYQIGPISPFRDSGHRVP